jgi:hypothetical protein
MQFSNLVNCGVILSPIPIQHHQPQNFSSYDQQFIHPREANGNFSLPLKQISPFDIISKQKVPLDFLTRHGYLSFDNSYTHYICGVIVAITSVILIRTLDTQQILLHTTAFSIFLHKSIAYVFKDVEFQFGNISQIPFLTRIFTIVLSKIINNILSFIIPSDLIVRYMTTTLFFDLSTARDSETEVLEGNKIVAINKNIFTKNASLIVLAYILIIGIQYMYDSILWKFSEKTLKKYLNFIKKITAFLMALIITFCLYLGSTNNPSRLEFDLFLAQSILMSLITVFYVIKKVLKIYNENQNFFVASSGTSSNIQPPQDIISKILDAIQNILNANEQDKIMTVFNIDASSANAKLERDKVQRLLFFAIILMHILFFFIQFNKSKKVDTAKKIKKSKEEYIEKEEERNPNRFLVC